MFNQETNDVDSPLPISSQTSIEFPLGHQSNDEEDNLAVSKERNKVLPGKFQRFWKFGRNLTSEETRSNGIESSKSDVASSSATHSASYSSSKGDTDPNVMNTLKNFGNTMLEHIQAVFQHARSQFQAGLMENISKTNLIEKTAMTALKELLKISNILLEM